MQKKMILPVLVLLAIICLPILFTSTSATPVQSSTSTIEEEKSVFTNDPVYILGTSNTTPKLEGQLAASTSAITTIDLKGLSNLVPERDMLIVDGQWLQSNSDKAYAGIHQVLAKGIPVIFINGSPKDDLKAAIAGLTVPIANTDQNLIATGYKYYPQTGAGANLNIGGTPNDDSKDITLLVNVAYNWGSKYVSNILPNPAPEHHSPYYQYLYNYYYYSYDTCSPKGRFDVSNDYYRLQEDGSSTYKWIDEHKQLRAIPGSIAYGNGWHTTDMNNRLTVQGSSFLNRYSPTTTVGGGSHTISIGVTAGQNGGAVTLGQSWSYDFTDADAADQSPDNANYKLWTNVNENSAVGSNTYYIQPGVTVRTPDSAYWAAEEQDKVTFAVWPYIVFYWFDVTYSISYLG